MSKSVQSAREALSKAIEARQAAAAVKADALAAFVAVAGSDERDFHGNRTGSTREDSRSALWRARDRVEELEKRRDEILAVNGGDRVDLHRVFIGDYGKDADDLIAEAAADVTAREKALAALEARMMKLDVSLTAAEQDTDVASEAVRAASKAVIREQLPAIMANVEKAHAEVLAAIGALIAITEKENLRHREVSVKGHPLHRAAHLLHLYESLWLSTGIQEERMELAVLSGQGAQPWRDALDALLLDASAPLPTDTPPAARKAAA